MVCEHLSELERQLLEQGYHETWRGQAWTVAREWVYFDCHLPLDEIREIMRLDPCVENREHWGTHDGVEYGFVCTVHHDAVMGRHPQEHGRIPTFHPTPHA